MASLITIEHVTKRFPGVVALNDVSLDIAAGELHAVVGENGAGKSTLMKILAGVIPDYEGRLLLRGEPVRFRGPRDAEEAGISIIHQELNLVEQLSAAANIFLGREKRNRLGLLDDRAMERAAGALLGELECHISPRQPVRELRVGDQQLVEIAKALALETDILIPVLGRGLETTPQRGGLETTPQRILIMDEPTSALTEAEVARLFRVIDRLRQRGVTILYISHKLDEVFRLADRITVLRDGRLVRTLPRAATTPREITHLMVGREIESVDLGNGRTPGDVVLEVRNLSLPWTGHARAWRLRDISFTLRRGEILGIAGLMGAGRTELLECLFGSSPEPPHGRILLEGREVRFTHPAEARRAGIALVTEDRKRLGLFAHLTVGENITICTLDQAATAGLVHFGRERRLAEGVISNLAIKTAGPSVPITSLSGGNQQKTIIGRWLLTRPKVLLLDDPTRGVDVGAKAELYRLMDRLCREGLGIIVTSSELPELLTLCDRILVLCEGRLTGEFVRHEATEQRIMEAATARTVATVA
ncbi:MAG TPA: sugar ABC transporter ATP-binding protein [Gemmataceae bacterium]|nr:sugar ABC transporter ATP-binding protein [Gemmataceae bacterium]